MATFPLWEAYESPLGAIFKQDVSDFKIGLNFFRMKFAAATRRLKEHFTAAGDEAIQKDCDQTKWCEKLQILFNVDIM